MAREFTVVIERDSEGFFVASAPALRGCHTQAGSRDELDIRIKEAIALCLEDSGSNVSELELVGIERVTVAA